MVLSSGTFLGPYFKSTSSIRTKGVVSDAIRYTWVFSKFPNMNDVIKTIPKNVRFFVDDHRPLITPYDGIHITLNYLIEVQIHTPESLMVRDNEIHHRLYRIKRYNDHISMKYDDQMDKKMWEIYENIYMESPLPMSLSLPIKDASTDWDTLLKSIEFVYDLNNVMN